MPVLVVLASKAFGVVIAIGYWTSEWSLGLMSEHVSLEILEGSAAFCASSFLTITFITGYGSS